MYICRTNDVIESIMKDGVKEGVIIEALEEETPAPVPALEAVK